MAAAALRLGERPGLRGVGRWVHMLGFRGHFVTKSRGYSTTLGELRAARADYRAQQDEPPGYAEADDDSTEVLSVWQYIGSGYLNSGDVLLAAGVEASLRAAREAPLDLRRSSGTGLTAEIPRTYLMQLASSPASGCCSARGGALSPARARCSCSSIAVMCCST
jgi:hypothetical protein